MPATKRNDEVLDLRSSVDTAKAGGGKPPPNEPTGRLERTQPYLTAVESQNLIEEKTRLEKMIDPRTPEYIRAAVDDPDEVRKQLRNIGRKLDRDAPHPYDPKQVDAAVKRERELLKAIVQDMPSQVEMRRNPPGAVDKNLNFHNDHKEDVLEWKNIRRCLHASGVETDGKMHHDVSNLERYRPHSRLDDLSTDNAQIPGKQYHFPKGPIPIHNGVSDEEHEAFKAAVAAEVARQLAEREQA